MHTHYNILKSYRLVLLIFFLLGCGGEFESSEPKLNVVLKGSLVAPDSAAGSHTPQYAELDVVALTLVIADTEEPVELDIHESGLRVIGREQIVYSTKLAEQAGKVISSVSLELSESVILGGQSDTYPASFTTTEVTASPEKADLSFEKNETVDVTLYLDWLDTIDQDAASAIAPSLRLEVSEY